MALQPFMSGKPCNKFLSSAKSPFHLWFHHLPSLTNSVKTSSHLQECLATKTNQENFRPLANFPPSVWKDSDDIFTSNPLPHLELYDDKRIEELKEEVKGMLMASINDLVQKISLINSICRLGLGYHFETEIEQILNHIFEAHPNFAYDNDYDLYPVTLMFQVFRQHGYKMCCDVFNKFKGCDGKFKEDLTSDVKGMLNLYEVAHLRIHGEDILEEALGFTKGHLTSLLVAETSPHLAKQIINALEQPLHRGIPRLEARKYISFYEEDESRNETLLMFAKLDFNRVQLLHRQELSCIRSWWKNSNLESKLPYAKERIVELYFWMAAMYFEPCYSNVRLMGTKFITMCSLMDDTYDAYGTLKELQDFTEAMQRWDTNALDQLTDCMKFLYKAILDLFEELNNYVSEERRTYSISCAKDKVKEMTRAYFVEAQWCNKGYVPPFEEYLENGTISAGCFSVTAVIFALMGDMAGINAFKWLDGKPKIVKASYIFGRLIDDIMSHQFEQERRHVASSVECYMKQYGISREETIEKINTTIENAWKDMNEECQRPTVISMQLLTGVVNLARSTEVTYKNIDGYTNPEYLKDRIIEFIIDPIPI